jgi:hypothetical protein
LYGLGWQETEWSGWLSPRVNEADQEVFEAIEPDLRERECAIGWHERAVAPDRPRAAT